MREVKDVVVKNADLDIASGKTGFRGWGAFHAFSRIQDHNFKHSSNEKSFLPYAIRRYG